MMADMWRARHVPQDSPHEPHELVGRPLTTCVVVNNLLNNHSGTNKVSAFLL